MKKFLKAISFCLLLVLAMSNFIACDDHEHKYDWYLVTSPTCAKRGVMEGVCECGDKIFEELKSSGHNFVNGTCFICGQNENETLQTVEPGAIVGLGINDIYEKFKSFGYNYTFENFTSSLNSWTLQNIKIDILGALHLTLEKQDFSTNLTLPSIRVDFNLSNADQLANILQLKVENDSLLCVYADGTMVSFGKIGGVSAAQTGKTLRSIFINKDNIVGVVYSDDTVKPIGNIASSSTAINGAQLCFTKIEGKQEYKVVGTLNNTSDKIEIPATHLGVPVTQIGKWAFYGNTTITQVVMGENIKKIDGGAFFSCSNLTSVKLNQGLQEIGIEAFYNCSKLQRPVIPSSLEICGENAFATTNCSIYVDLNSKPSNWAEEWCGTNNKVYWKGEWEYINETPVPLQ